MESFKMLGLLMLLSVLAVCTLHISSAMHVSYDERAMTINGERKIIISGSIHYPRSTPQMWPSLVKKAKEGGLNAIETYVFWNAHEPIYRQYDFSGNLDLIKFIKVIQDEGLYAILRIGPYVCAEWNFGGFPVWLSSIPNITFRTKNQAFMNEMKTFTAMIVDKVKDEKLFASQGGPIILAQIENEYGNVISSYGNDGKYYMDWCANFAETLGVGVPWIMCQESDAPSYMINTCNGYYCHKFKPNKNVPKFWTENWVGWFKDWGSQDPHRTAEDIAFAVARFFQYGGTLQNYYMYHGGTNFGRTSGGPYITTSYDYDAPINEYGELNQPKYGHLKKLHSVILSMEKVLTYGSVTNKDYSNTTSVTVYSYNKTRACFIGNENAQDAITIDFEGRNYTIPAWSVSILPDCVTEAYNTAKVSTQTSVVVKKLPTEAREKHHYNFQWTWRPQHFAHLRKKKIDHLKGVNYADRLLDQKVATNDTSDYLWYITSVDVDENDPIWGEEISVSVRCSCHVLHAFFNGKYIGTEWVTNGQFGNMSFDRSAKLIRGTNTLSLLSVTVGLQNYGAHFDKTKNGIRGSVKLIAPNSMEKDLTSNTWGYKVELNGAERGLGHKHIWRNNVPFDTMFVWYKTTFKTPKGSDPVVVDLWGMGKGVAWVNGHNIGRYWPSFLTSRDNCDESCDYRGSYYASKCSTNCGNSSQRWYHVPRSFLNSENNTLILFEEFGGNPTSVKVEIVTVEKVLAHAYEGATLELSCQGNHVISKINFASFGNPNVTHGYLKKGSCHSYSSLSVVEQACLGKGICSIDVSQQTFGRSLCDNLPQKRLAVEVECF